MPEGRGRIDVKLSTGTVGRSTVDWQHTTLVRHWAMGIVAADKAALEAGVGGRVMSGLAKLWLRRAANARVSLKVSMASKVPIGDCSGLELVVEIVHRGLVNLGELLNVYMPTAHLEERATNTEGLLDMMSEQPWHLQPETDSHRQMHPAIGFAFRVRGKSVRIHAPGLSR